VDDFAKDKESKMGPGASNDTDQVVKTDLSVVSEENQEKVADEGQVEKENTQNNARKYFLYGLLSIAFLTSLVLNIALLISDTGVAQENYSTLYLLLGIILAAATLVSTLSLMISQYNRVVYLKNGPALVPEKWGLLVERLVLATKELEMQLMDTHQVVLEKSSETESISGKLLESFLTLQEMISTRDLEIERLKKGYDSTVYRKFLRRFIRLERSLGIMEADAESALEKKNYRYLSRLLEDALEECGVEAYTPTIGSDYRNAGKEVADDPEELETDIEEEDFLIKQCVETGFLLRGEADYEVIKQAKVKITRFKPTV